MTTKIEWADEVWNPTVGCTPVSTGCAHCYARRMFDRGMTVYNHSFDQVTAYESRLEIPLRWQKPRRVFVDSMSDLFHPMVSDEFILKVFDVMSQAKQHTFLILSKRMERMSSFMNKYSFVKSFSWPLENVWMGVSVEDQRSVNERIPLLLNTPAALRFISAEPLINKITLSDLLYPIYGLEDSKGPNPGIDWVICGGESGPGARPLHPDWVRSLRDECNRADIPFFFKQWGEWSPEIIQGLSMANRAQTWFENHEFYHVGKKLAGALIDGIEHKVYPEVKK